jgi:hypothetical protein
MFQLKSLGSHLRVPSQPGNQGKPGKRLSLFPVREKSGNLGKVPEIREKSGNFVWADFPNLSREVHTIKTANYFLCMAMVTL